MVVSKQVNVDLYIAHYINISNALSWVAVLFFSHTRSNGWTRRRPCLWHIASVATDLRLPSRPQSTASTHSASCRE